MSEPGVDYVWCHKKTGDAIAVVRVTRDRFGSIFVEYRRVESAEDDASPTGCKTHDIVTIPRDVFLKKFDIDVFC